jgi:apolipoprotein N-acyltransferase
MEAHPIGVAVAGSAGTAGPERGALPHCARTMPLVPITGVVVAAILYSVACPPYEWSLAAWAVPGVILTSTKGLRWPWALLGGAAWSLLIGWGITGWAYDASLEYFAFNRLLSAGFVAAVWLVYGGIPYGLLLALYGGVARHFPSWTRAPLGAWLWVLAELLRASLLTGMPWELLGHTQFRHLLLIQIADLGGVSAVSFVMALSSLSVTELLWELRRRGFVGRELAALVRRVVGHVALPAAVLLAVVLYGVERRAAYGRAPAAPDAPTLAIIQGNIQNEFRWKRAFFERTLQSYAMLSRTTVREAGSPRPDLVIWPENAVNFYLNREPLLRMQMRATAALGRHGLLLGAPRLTEEGRAHNSAYLLGPDGEIASTYDKRRLVPLAEYNPWRPGVGASPEEPIYTPGGEAAPLTVGGMRLGTVICYEVLFPHLVRDLVRKGADLLVNLSNDAWLDAGDGAARRQHFSMAVFRAIETRRTLVRAAATGVSGFIDPSGAMYGTLPGDTADGVVQQVVLRHEMTPYVRWGDAWVLLTSVGLLPVLVARARFGDGGWLA